MVTNEAMWPMCKNVWGKDAFDNGGSGECAQEMLQQFINTMPKRQDVKRQDVLLENS
jgi:hypothetical protein